jgi:DNA-binding FrmR family transcriptional regulator
MEHVGSPEQRRSIVNRLRRVEGQLRAIQRMVEEGEDCERVAQQMSASRKALERAYFEMFACAIEAASASRGGEQRTPAGRLARLFGKFA